MSSTDNLRCVYESAKKLKQIATLFYENKIGKTLIEDIDEETLEINLYDFLDEMVNISCVNGGHSNEICMEYLYNDALEHPEEPEGLYRPLGGSSALNILYRIKLNIDVLLDEMCDHDIINELNADIKNVLNLIWICSY